MTHTLIGHMQWDDLHSKLIMVPLFTAFADLLAAEHANSLVGKTAYELTEVLLGRLVASSPCSWYGVLPLLHDMSTTRNDSDQLRLVVGWWEVVLRGLLIDKSQGLF